MFQSAVCEMCNVHIEERNRHSGHGLRFVIMNFVRYSLKRMLSRHGFNVAVKISFRKNFLCSNKLKMKDKWSVYHFFGMNAISKRLDSAVKCIKSALQLNQIHSVVQCFRTYKLSLNCENEFPFKILNFNYLDSSISSFSNKKSIHWRLSLLRRCRWQV